MTEMRLKIAVFIDFDNIEIGVKTTLGGQFDVGAVLDAIRERGEVVTKIAYGDWTRATDYGRALSQHAIHMVQRNMTPGGDKNGADINLALDALEMAFTHNHINAFVIVGGDSDFITLVEKLKQYDRKVFVVGGRSFTSHVLQKNCTEFMAYEDIIGPTSPGRPAGGRGRIQTTDIAEAMPLVRRALQLLADREVTPQLGLLKSTLLQLDSSFSERAYGVNSFRDFVAKLASRGWVVLKGAERSGRVELREASPPAAPGGRGPVRPAHPATPLPPEQTASPEGSPADAQDARGARAADTWEAAGPRPAVTAEMASDQSNASAEGQPVHGPAEGYRRMVAACVRPEAPPRFPMYVRQWKIFLKTADPHFDEQRYGFSGVVDALRFAQREGLLHLDRDRHGAMRVHAGPQYLALTQPRPADTPTEPAGEVEGFVPTESVPDTALATDQTPAPDLPPVEAPPVSTAAADAAAQPASPEVSVEAGSPEAESTPPAPRAPRKRTSTRTTRPKKAVPRAAEKKKAETPKRSRAKKA